MSKLRLVECRPFFDAVLEKSTEMGVGVCSAVVNAEGHVIALEARSHGNSLVGAQFKPRDVVACAPH